MKKLSYEDLIVNDEFLPEFDTTEEFPSCEILIGQDRARRAVETGLKIREKGYNIFVAGPTGTGRRTFVQNVLREVAKNRPRPRDWAYVYNFDDPQSPKAFSLEPGLGKEFKKDMGNLIDEVIEALNRLFESEEYASKRAEIEDEYTKAKNELWEKLKMKARELGFSIQLTPTGVLTVPMMDGKPVTPDIYELLPEEKRKEIEEASMKVKHLVEGTLHRSRKLDRELKEKLQELDRYGAIFVIGNLFDELKKKYSSNSDIIEYLEKVKSDVLDNLQDLRSEESEKREFYKKKYSVNLIVDNSDSIGAPVVYERNPTYSNLFGKVEYYAKLGVLQTDFTMIRSGSLHKANGGFIILDAEDVLRNIHVWEGLKRTLMSGWLTVENLENVLGFSSTMTLKPQPVPIDVKVFMIGTPLMYELLYTYDEDFRKLFKIKAEFDWEMENNESNVKDYLSFISSICNEHELPHLTREAAKRVLWYSTRLSGDRTKLSARFGEISKLIIEAGTIAKMSKKNLVEEKDITTTIESMEERVRLLQEKYDNMLKEYDLMVEVTGEKIGQINGLTVIELGDHSFGIPVKITAKTYLGKAGVVDIQREADLSGKIHGKAVLILEGFFGSKYAQKTPISFSASISFEQVYTVVEGDSASLAETLALISSISKVPIKQNIAVTGSINQHGEVQPVGGVTEKVEGFFRTCKMRGLTGDQGVIIPRGNIKNLILKDEILEAVKKGIFHIWAVENVDEAIEIVTGRKAGKLTKKGVYEKGSVNYLVSKELERIKKLLEEKEEKKGKKKGKKK